MIDKKKIRTIIGYTHERQLKNANSWHSLAVGFHAAAKVLDEFSDRIPSNSRPFALNAALSIELILKAILARKNIDIPDGASGHDLRSLCAKAQVNLSKNQKITLEMLTETIVWAGRYPGPKNEQRWDDYQDRILEKHLVRGSKGNVHSTMANPETFPDCKNYERIWDECIVEFRNATSS